MNRFECINHIESSHTIPWHHDTMTLWLKESLVSFRHLATVRMSETALALHWLNSRAGLWFITWPYKDLCIHHCNRFTRKKHTQKKFKSCTFFTGTKIGTSGGFCTSTSWHSKRWSRQRCEAKLTAAHPTFEDCPGTPESILHELMKIVQMIKYTGKHMVNIW